MWIFTSTYTYVAMTWDLINQRENVFLVVQLLVQVYVLGPCFSLFSVKHWEGSDKEMPRSLLN
jgi:hypothetical protein